MKKRRDGSHLPRTGLAAKKGHRSHSKGEHRMLSGRNGGYIKDALVRDAQRLERKYATGALERKNVNEKATNEARAVTPSAMS